MGRHLDRFVVQESQPIVDALRTIEGNGRYFVLVLSGKKVVGTFTDGDLRHSLLRGASIADEVGSVCNRNFFSLSEGQTADDAIKIMQKSKRRFLPVLNEKGELLNIVTKSALEYLYLQNGLFDLRFDFLSIDEFLGFSEIYIRPWGFYKSTVLNDRFQSKILHLRPNGCLSLQKHSRREEHWIVVQGEGRAQVGGETFGVCPGAKIVIPRNTLHRLQNESSTESLIVVEVQFGDYFGEDDIVRFDDSYGRV